MIVRNVLKLVLLINILIVEFFSSFLFLFDEILLNIECKPALYTADSLHGLFWDIYFIKCLHTVYKKVLSNAVACFIFVCSCFHNLLFYSG